MELGISRGLLIIWAVEYVLGKWPGVCSKILLVGYSAVLDDDRVCVGGGGVVTLWITLHFEMNMDATVLHVRMKQIKEW